MLFVEYVETQAIDLPKSAVGFWILKATAQLFRFLKVTLLVKKIINSQLGIQA